MIPTSSSSTRLQASRSFPVVATPFDEKRDFVEAVLRHRRALSTYAQMLARERTAAEDLTQDTLERALRAVTRFKAGTNLRAWLMRIMRNLFTDGCRRSAVIRSVNAQILVDDVVPEPSAVSCVDLVSMADVEAALAELDPRQRQIFELAYVERLPYGTIAEQLHIPVSTVGTRIWRAKAALRRALKKAGLTSLPGEAANDVGRRRRRPPPHR